MGLSSKRSHAGMSLMEVLMSLAILAVAILGVLSAVAYGTRAGAYGQRVTEATNYARQISEIIRSEKLAWKNAGAPDAQLKNGQQSPQVPLNDGPSFADLPGNTGYWRVINCSQVANPGGVPEFAFLYKIEVIVRFYERGSVRQVIMNSYARRQQG